MNTKCVAAPLFRHSIEDGRKFNCEKESQIVRLIFACPIESVDRGGDKKEHHMRIVSFHINRSPAIRISLYWKSLWRYSVWLAVEKNIYIRRSEKTKTRTPPLWWSRQTADCIRFSLPNLPPVPSSYSRIDGGRVVRRHCRRAPDVTRLREMCRVSFFLTNNDDAPLFNGDHVLQQNPSSTTRHIFLNEPIDRPNRPKLLSLNDVLLPYFFFLNWAGFQKKGWNHAVLMQRHPHFGV